MKSLTRILYVDDEADIREIVAMSLELLGDVVVHTCASGDEALEQLPCVQPDIVLLDVMMPGRDGPSTLVALRRQKAFEDTPVIFVTAKVMPNEVARFMKLGAAGVIAKPFDPMLLGSQVKAIWDARSRSTDALHAKLERTRLLFLDRTRADLASIRVLAGPTAQLDAAGCDTIRHVAHRIHGSGAMFGFPRVSDAAARFEDLMEAGTNRAAPARDDILAQCDLLSDALAADARGDELTVAMTA